MINLLIRLKKPLCNFKLNRKQELTVYRTCQQVWIFGDVWCQMWLALDVWMCTASILNLCAISLDRYVAVTRPITYPSIMSHSRAKMLIAGVWVLSFVICFPPLVGWKDAKVTLNILPFKNTLSSQTKELVVTFIIQKRDEESEKEIPI
ncbi:unnamed protein product [Brassicogethes aeneus]|uniref:G-protein coupled receptors family 1 profile domain-containing protein n=1 Tax=Brassicogethes aeneus TaxID=1431903 RepID=A0A9P0B7I0_BRAAE|nr:unnamed protein product [Brassicogethes aeneus]